MSFRVMITAAGGAMSPLTIQCLKNSRRHAIAVIAADSRADAAGQHFADAFVQLPPGGDPGYVAAALNAARTNGANLLLPCSDEEALALAPEAERFAAFGCQLACAPAATLRLFADKGESYRMMAKAGIRVPDFRAVTDPALIAPALDDMIARHGEAAIKPATGRGGRDIYVIRRDLKGLHPFNGGRELHLDIDTCRREIMPRLAALTPLLILERLHEPVFDIDVLASRGRALRIAPRRRLNPAGIPFTGGVMENDPRLFRLAESVVKATALSWLYDIDVMSGASGQPIVIELNPRPSGSIAAAVMAGVPLLDDLVSLAKGEELPPVEFPSGVTVLPYTAVTVLAA